ncbi:MAG: VWA domain-containing protein [Acidobacteriota bacterium]
MAGFTPADIAFEDPAFLWLLAVPALLTLVWAWRAWRRAADLSGLARHRTLPVRERRSLFGDLPGWLLLIVATTALILAAARPTGPAATIRRSGIDLVVLADASASMHVTDVPGNRWQSAMRFTRRLGDALAWRDDRVAMTVFAHVATPQVRLTRDPNTFFFFLDHLDTRPPFRLEDDTTWDTNLEQAVYWGLRLIEKDQEMQGRSPNARMFVLLTDGEAWSGEVAKSIDRVTDAGIPLHVVGVGTLGGGRLPDGADDPNAVSRLDRRGLQRIAAAGGGQYFELERDGADRIAAALVDLGRRAAPGLTLEARGADLYPRLLAAAMLLAAAAWLFLREKTELALQLAGVSLAAVALARMLA